MILGTDWGIQALPVALERIVDHKGGFRNPPLVISGDNLHPLLPVAIDDHGSTAEFNAPIIGDVQSMMLASEVLGAIGGSGSGSSGPGGGGDRVGDHGSFD